MRTKEQTRMLAAEIKRLARLEIKAKMKEHGIKVTYVAARDLTRCVNVLLEDPETKAKLEHTALALMRGV